MREQTTGILTTNQCSSEYDNMATNHLLLDCEPPHNLRLQADGPGVGSIDCKQGKKLRPAMNRPLEGA